MTTYQPLNYGDLRLYLESYQAETEVLLDYLSESHEGDFEAAPHRVGQLLEHMVTKPDDVCPRFSTPRGKQLVVGVIFGDENPVLILAPCDES